MEEEMEALENDFKAVEESYAENMLNLTVIRVYLKRLMEDGKVVRFLGSKHPDLFTEFERVVATENL